MDIAPTCVLAFVRRLLECFKHWATVRKMCTCQGDNYMDTRQTCPTDTVTCIHTLTRVYACTQVHTQTQSAADSLTRDAHVHKKPIPLQQGLTDSGPL